MGGVWLERHLPLILCHILDLLTHSKTTSTHIDAVYSRKCIGFIIKSVFNRLLGESAQLAATKHLCSLIIQYTNHTSSNGLSNELGIYLCMYLSIYLCTYVCIYVCMYVCI